MLKYLRPYSWTVAAELIIKFLGTVAELFLPLLLKYIIDEVAPAGDIAAVVYHGLAMLGFSFVALFGNIIANRLSASCAGKMTHDLRYALFSKITYLTGSQTDEVGVPSLVSRLTSDTYYVNQMVARTLRMGVRAPILLIGGLIMSFTLDAHLALVLLAAVPFVALAVVIITKKSVPCYAYIQSEGDEMVRSMQENITGVRVVRALCKEDAEAQKFRAVSKELSSREFRANKIMSLTNPLVTLILNLALVAVIIVGGLRSSEPGLVLAFLSYITIIMNGMLGISKIFVVLSRGIASGARIREVLKYDARQETGEYPPSEAGYKLQFEGVSFSYNGRQDNVKNISFGIAEGETLGVIGATGSGKSTLLNLMLRFYEAERGAIYVDGKNIKSYPPEELRARFGAAFQNDFLTATTVRENVDYGRGLSDGEIIRALKDAQAWEFVEQNGGLDFTIAQKAANLSGGQRQRLCIARALAGPPQIIVLDDSSSALDYATDARLRQALSENYAGVTKIIIAQRISSVKGADKIIVMDEGEIIGCGTHEALMADCAEYGRIYAAQMGEDL